VPRLRAFLANHLANIVWAFAKLGIEAPAMFEAIEVEAQYKILSFDSQALANLAWAYATAGVEAEALLEAVADRCLEKYTTFNAQNLTNLLWSFSTANFAAPQLFAALVPKVYELLGSCTAEGKSQLYQVSMHFRLDAPHCPLTRLLLEREAELQAAYLRQAPRPSRTQTEVSDCLRFVGWDHDFEHITPEGLSLDMAQPESKLAVEFDGPTHYVLSRVDNVESRTKLDGKSKAEERLLRKFGWRLIRIPFFEWDEVHRCDADREAYLHGKLAQLYAQPVP